MILILSSLALIVAIAVAIPIARARITKARVAELRVFAQSLEAQVAIGSVTREQALNQLRDRLRLGRPGDSSDYLLVKMYDGQIVICGDDAKCDGELFTPRNARQ